MEHRRTKRTGMRDPALPHDSSDGAMLLMLMLQAERSVAAGRGSSTQEVMQRLRARLRSRPPATT